MFTVDVKQQCNNNAKIIKGSNSINTDYRVTIPILCTFANDPLSKYQVSFNFLVFFQRYAPDKLLIAELKREVTP